MSYLLYQLLRDGVEQLISLTYGPTKNNYITLGGTVELHVSYHFIYGSAFSYALKVHSWNNFYNLLHEVENSKC